MKSPLSTGPIIDSQEKGAAPLTMEQSDAKSGVCVCVCVCMCVCAWLAPKKSRKSEKAGHRKR